MSETARVPDEYWQDRRVLVTGATGLVGGRLVRQLVARGADIVTLVRDRVRGCEYVRRNLRDACTEVRGELENLSLLERILAEYEIHTVFHLAAQTIVGIGVRSPISTFEANIRGTYHLLEAARRNPTVKGVVVASSPPLDRLPELDSFHSVSLRAASWRSSPRPPPWRAQNRPICDLESVRA